VGAERLRRIIDEKVVMSNGGVTPLRGGFYY